MQSSSILKLALRAIAFGGVLVIVWTLFGDTFDESWPKALWGTLGWTLVETVRLFFAKRRALRS